ncbi:Wzz/FepE/Etk N-terminal domain-containing protein [Brevundimonas sp.]|uniref:Wzz/FepE/Etk N-terminal domain-containing protein n=1 Tax=Brevundimonas sp. TaxID=1871086 RepID=UPI00289A4D19|nr:Wzz/FepE/Etk N-terminal domain-containing protein [Brevundimonas sp.]
MTLTDPSPASADCTTSDEIDIDAWIAGLRRRAGLFAGVAAVVALIVLAVMLGRPPAYTAVASLQINTRNAQVVAGPAVLSALDAEAAIADTEVEVCARRNWPPPSWTI